MSYMKDSTGRRLDSFKPLDEIDAAKLYSRGELVHVETNATRVVGSSTIGAIPGLDLTVTILDRPVRLTGTLPYISATGTPSVFNTTLVLTIQDVTAGGAGVEVARLAQDLTAANVSTAIRPLTYRVPAGGGVRRYQLRAGLFDGSKSAIDLGIASTRPATFHAEEL